MADEEHLVKLHKGVGAWNQWRRDCPGVKPDLKAAYLIRADLRELNLSGADLRRADLGGADLSGADLRGADLDGADLSRAVFGWGAQLRDVNLRNAKLIGTSLCGADLKGVNLSRGQLIGADLSGADLRAADFSQADLGGAFLSSANLSEANLQDACLYGASLVATILDGARLDGCNVYGVSVWDASLNNTSQLNLVITSQYEKKITVDSLKLAQFIHLLLKNEEVRHIIDTITSKVVLILGRFTEERKRVLDALRQELRTRDYTPIVFDFEKPASRDLTETILTLASMARFVIADISAAKSIPQELSHIIPHLPSVPVQPILLASDREYAMFKHWKCYPWVLPDFLYEDEAHLLASLTNKVIEPAEQKRQEQTKT